MAEERLGAVQELLLLLADPYRVDVEGPRQLGQGPGPLDGLQGDLGLEGGRMTLLTYVGHVEPRDATVTFDQFYIPMVQSLGFTSWLNNVFRQLRQVTLNESGGCLVRVVRTSRVLAT